MGKSLRNPDKAPSYHEFEIARPMGEGDKPTADNGFDRFEDVRGDSGTRVTIVVNDEFVRAGMLNEDKLKPLLTKIFETSEYTLAFSTDSDSERLIGASKLEEEALGKTGQETEDAADHAKGKGAQDSNDQQDDGKYTNMPATSLGLLVFHMPTRQS